MTEEIELPLTIEPLSDDTGSNFLIHSKNEIQFILRSIGKTGARVALYFDGGNDRILTTLLGVNEEGVWLDVGPKKKGDMRILNSQEFIVVSSHNQVKVQFVAHLIKNVLFGNHEAYYLPLPDSLLRIQHRDYFRLRAPFSKPLTCIIPARPGARPPKRELPITDIGEGGVSLACEDNETELQPGKIFQNCQIPLPDTGMLTATLKVKNLLEITLPNGEIKKRAGCEFINMNGKMAILLQRYLTRMQSQNLAQR